MATAIAAPINAQARRHWFWEFLREELEPYPERVQLVGRMVLSATLVMLVCNAYRVPYGFQAGIIALFVSRESTKATINSALTMVLGLIAGTVFVIASAAVFTANPVLHYIWVGFALFSVFFALSTVNSYIGVLMFAAIVTIAIPLWDRPVPAEVNVEDTLWLLWAGVLGAASTFLVEIVFAKLRPGDNVIFPVAERLAAVENVMRCYAEGRSPDALDLRQINRFAMLGTSLARRYSQRSGFNLPYVARTGGVISLVGTLVDTTASLTQLPVRPSEEERRRARELADNLSRLRVEFLRRHLPTPISLTDLSKETPGLPLLRELERTVELIPQVFAAPPSAQDDSPTEAPPAAPLVAHDTFTNIEHMRFGVKGTMAAMLCYMLYTALPWPGISTSVVTCAFTALTTIGASRQKQVLRLLGAAVGGFVLAMGAQIFIFPSIDTIFGFAIVFVIVTALSAWFMSASPRISYFGVQMALAFYLVHLQAFRFETSLSIARDRVVGVLLGLFAMWLIFDQLWGHPAGVEMRRVFVKNLRLLAQLALPADVAHRKESLRQAYALGQTINANFDQVRSLGDAVIFEFGASRAADLASRNRIREWQSRLRAIFLLRGAALRYRLEMPGFELPRQLEPAQRDFDTQMSAVFDGMADRMEGIANPKANHLAEAFERLEEAAKACDASASTHLSDFMALSRTAEQLALSVAQDVQR
jgi:multidrug resistance protein MdtO